MSSLFAGNLDLLLAENFSFLWPTTAASSCVQGNGIKRVGKKRKAKTTSTTHSSYSGRQRQRQRQGMKMEKRILG